MRTSLGSLAIAFGLLLSPAPVLPQAPSADAAEVLEEARELQREFEAYRESRTPVQRESRSEAACDERIGRICIWFGGDEEEEFPRELREVGQARTELIRGLSDALEQTRDRWVVGQLVHYLVEARELPEADRVARACGIEETWWCSALLGYVLHVGGRHVSAEAAFREALAAMPEAEREVWTSPRYILTPDAQEAFRAGSPEEREERWELFWRLSDPLFLFDGNDRLTDHYARLVEAVNRRDAVDPLGLEWEEDLEETLIRYGRNTGYGRTHNPGQTFGFGGIRDTRRMFGFHHPKSRGYLFPEQFLESPSDIPPESWITAPREARTWYAPPYAPEIRGLETQVGRFRRDARMLVVGAYRPTLPDEDTGEWIVPPMPSGDVPGSPHTALYLIPEDGGEPFNGGGRDSEGVLAVQAPPGRYVSSLEVVDLEGKRAWRARQGVVQLPLVPGQVDVSDLMILKEGTPLPETLDEAIPHVRPGVRLRAGERFPVVWEVYGLRIQEPIRVTIGFSEGRPGFLERVGEFVGVIEPPQNMDVTFDDTGPDRVQSVFRAVQLALPDLDPGEYTLHLRLELTGREPVVTSRPIVVER